jgi:hypothetical protein
MAETADYEVSSQQYYAALVDLCMVLLEWLSPGDLVEGLLSALSHPNGDAMGIAGHPTAMAIRFGLTWETGDPCLPYDVPLSTIRQFEKDRAANRRLTALQVMEAFVHGVLRERQVQTLNELRCVDMASEPEAHRYLVENLLVVGQPATLGGPPKTMKTTLAMDLAISLSSGQPFLGMYSVPAPVRVVMFSGESGRLTLCETARRIAKERAAKTLPVIYDVLPPLDALPGLVHREQAEVVILDPLYLLLRGAQMTSLADVGAMLADLNAAVAPATLVVVHHTTKDIRPGRPLTITDLSGAGVAEWARQWLLVNRRKPYNPAAPGQHKLVLTGGGCAGHSFYQAVDIEEGDLSTGRVYRVSVANPDEARRNDRQEKADRRGSATQDRRTQKVVEALRDLEIPVGGQVSSKKVREEAGLSGSVWPATLQALIADGVLSQNNTTLTRLR